MATSPFLPNERPPLRDEARFQAREMLEPFKQRKTDLLKSAASFQTIPNRAVAGDVADVIKIAGAIAKSIGDRRMELTGPYREAESTVNATVEEFWAELAVELERLNVLVDSFRRAEDDRVAEAQRAQEEERRRLREQNAPKPSSLQIQIESQSPPVVKADDPIGDAFHYQTAAPAARPIRGAYGAKVGTTKKIEARVVDVKLVEIEILESPTVKAAIEKVAKDLAKHRETIPGIEITRGDRTQIRS